MNAYTRCPRSKIAEVGGQLIDARWIDVDKGDYEDPVYRSRSLGREYRTPQRRQSIRGDAAARREVLVSCVYVAPAPHVRGALHLASVAQPRCLQRRYVELEPPRGAPALVKRILLPLQRLFLQPDRAAQPLCLHSLLPNLAQGYGSAVLPRQTQHHYERC